MQNISHIPVLAETIEDLYTVFITKDIKKSREFYTRWFGFTPVFESSWFILLVSPGKKSLSLAFMHEVHPSSPPVPKAMKGDGSFLTLQVSDAKKVYDSMIKAGLPVGYHLKDEDWGQRRFAVTDPSGMHVDIVEQTAPKEGFWEKYVQ